MHIYPFFAIKYGSFLCYKLRSLTTKIGKWVKIRLIELTPGFGKSLHPSPSSEMARLKYSNTKLFNALELYPINFLWLIVLMKKLWLNFLVEIFLLEFWLLVSSSLLLWHLVFRPPHGVVDPGQVVANFGVDLGVTLETALGSVTEEPNQSPAAIVLVPGYL